MSDDLHLPARALPMPSSVSPQARAVMIAAAGRPAFRYPALDDHEAWRKFVAETDAIRLAFYQPRCAALDHERSCYTVAGREVHVARPRGAPADRADGDGREAR